MVMESSYGKSGKAVEWDLNETLIFDEDHDDGMILRQDEEKGGTVADQERKRGEETILVVSDGRRKDAKVSIDIQQISSEPILPQVIPQACGPNNGDKALPLKKRKSHMLVLTPNGCASMKEIPITFDGHDADPMMKGAIGAGLTIQQGAERAEHSAADQGSKVAAEGQSTTTTTTFSYHMTPTKRRQVSRCTFVRRNSRRCNKVTAEGHLLCDEHSAPTGRKRRKTIMGHYHRTYKSLRMHASNVHVDGLEDVVLDDDHDWDDDDDDNDEGSNKGKRFRSMGSIYETTHELLPSFVLDA